MKHLIIKAEGNFSLKIPLDEAAYNEISEKIAIHKKETVSKYYPYELSTGEDEHVEFNIIHNEESIKFFTQPANAEITSGMLIPEGVTEPSGIIPQLKKDAGVIEHSHKKFEIPEPKKPIKKVKTTKK